MPVRAVCPECGATTTLDDDFNKTQVECAQCGSKVAVPGATPASPPPLPQKVATAATGFEVLEDEKAPEPSVPARVDRADDKVERPAPRRDEDDAEGEEGGRPAVRRYARDADDEEDDAGRPAVGKRARDDNDDEDDMGRPATRRRDRDEDDEDDDERERPAARRRDRDDDDDEDDDDRERPAARRRDRDDDDDDELDDSPRRAAASSDDEDEAEEPQRRSGRVAVRASDDDEDDNEGFEPVDDDDDEAHSIPRRKAEGVYEGDRGDGGSKPRRKSGKAGLILLALFAFVLLGAGGGAAAYFMWPKDNKPVAKKDDGEKPPPVDPDPKIPDPKIPDPKFPDPKVPQSPLAIRPVSFDGERKTVPLPDKIKDSCACADGKFLILACSNQKKLLVYDTSEAAIVKEISTEGKDARFTAGATKLLIADNTNRKIERYDLITREKDKESTYPFEGTIEEISLGAGSNGPALVVVAPGGPWPVEFLDVETLGKADIGWKEAPAADLPRTVKFSAATNGSRWAGIPAAPNNRGAVIISREGKQVTAQWVAPDKDLGFASLSPDGQSLCSRLGATNISAAVARPPAPDSPSFVTPSASGPFFVHVIGAKGAGDEEKIMAGIATNSIVPPMVTTRIDVPQPYEPKDSMPPDRHIYFIPEAQALVVCPSAGEPRLEVVKLDLIGRQKSAGAFITSTPPDSFTPGKKLTYQVRSISARPDLTYRVTGLDGASIDPAGVLTWDVPAEEKRDRVTVRVSIVAGLTFNQNFDLFNSAAPAPKSPEPKSKSPEPKVPTVVTPGNIAPGVKLVHEPPGRLPISPPEMTERHVEVALPSPIRDACVGGGGRFIIFHCPIARKMLVFDVNTLKIEKTITLNAEDVLFAAGMEKLMVIYPEEKVVLRYSLASFKFEADINLEFRQRPTTAAMGSATAGPLIFGGVPSQNNASKMALTFVDLDTMKEVLIEKAEGDFKVSLSAAAHLRASANGQTLGAWLTQLRPSGLQVARLKDNTIGGSYVAENVGHVTPGPDGQTVFTQKGMYSTKGEPTGKRDPAVPAVHGNWYLTIAPNAKGPADAQRVSVWEAGKDAPIAEFDDLPGFDGKRDPFERDNPTLALDHRLFLVPEAKILVVVPPAANKLHVYRIGEMKK